MALLPRVGFSAPVHTCVRLLARSLAGRLPSTFVFEFFCAQAGRFVLFMIYQVLFKMFFVVCFFDVPRSEFLINYTGSELRMHVGRELRTLSLHFQERKVPWSLF